LTQQVADAVSIPVIASGGAGSAQHFIEVFQTGAPTRLWPLPSFISASKTSDN
jgi:imidazole glycerol-phosphate synthase subunit HisF